MQAPDTSLGKIISENQAAFATRPWLFWWPGVFIIAIALCINFIGDGLRDAFDPRQKPPAQRPRARRRPRRKRLDLRSASRRSSRGAEHRRATLGHAHSSGDPTPTPTSQDAAPRNEGLMDR